MLTLDTNVLIELDLANKPLISKLEEMKKDSPSNITIPSIVVSEYYYGFLRANKREAALKNLEFFEVLNTSKQSSLICAELKREAEQAGYTIPELDLLIASICIDNGVTLVTFDKQFEKVAELKKIILDF